MAEKRPSFQFYPGDWRKDADLCRCTKAAKGVWIDMLCLLFDCEERGVFSTGGVPWSDHEIAAAIGGDTAEVLSCVTELLRKGVAHRNKSGAIFSRRLVRDEQKRRELSEKRSESGKMGGRPSLKNKGSTGKKSKRKANAKQNKSSSSSTSVEEPPTPGGGNGVFENLPGVKIRKREMEHPEKLDAWILKNIPPPISEDTRLKIFACAIHALRNAKRSHARLFLVMVERGIGGEWTVPDADIQAASRMLRQAKRGGIESIGEILEERNAG